MGEEGFSSDSSLLYHRGRALGDRRQPGLGAARPVGHREPPAQAAAPQAARALRRRRRRRDAGAAPAAGARQRRRADLLRRGRRAPRRYYRNAVGDECVYVEAGQRHRRDGVRRAVLPHRRLRRGAARDDAPLAAGARPQPALRRSRPTATSRRRSATSPATASCSSTRRTASATCTARPSRFLVDGHRRRGARQAPRQRARRGPGRHPDDLRHAPLRRGRLGRLPLPLHVQRRGLHADHRQGAPAAAGAPGLRGLRTS